MTGVCSVAGVVLVSFPGQRKRGRMVWHPLFVHECNFPKISIAIATPVFLIKNQFLTWTVALLQQLSIPDEFNFYGIVDYHSEFTVFL